MADTEELRNILVACDQLRTIIDDHLLQSGDRAFRLALMYYNTVRDLARAGDPGARDVFNTLSLFFKRGSTGRAGEEPTEREVLRDAKALIRGSREGEIVIKSKSPAAAATAKERVLLDETVSTSKRNRGGVKATIAAQAAQTE